MKTDTSARVLKFARTHRRISSAQVSLALNIHQSTASNQLTRLTNAGLLVKLAVPGGRAFVYDLVPEQHDKADWRRKKWQII